METPTPITSKRSFYWEWTKLAIWGAWGVTGGISTGAGIGTAIFWHFHLGSLNNPEVIAKVNDLGGIYILIIPFSLILMFRLLLAPYWIYDDLRKRNERTIKELSEKLDTYECVPVTAIAKYNDSWIKILVTNRAHQQQRILGVHLSLLASFGEVVDYGPLLKSRSRIESFPHVMEPHSSFELEIAYTVDDLLNFGVQSFYAVVSFEDGREARGDIVDISTIRQRESFRLPMGLKESLARFERIRNFADTYTVLASGRNATNVDLALILQAGVLNLSANDELETACDLLFSKHVPHALKPQDFDDRVSILEFFREMATKNTNISGVAGAVELLHWRKERLTPLLQAPDTAVSLPEPSSLECPETDTRCSDC
jgi:hypothetical protein